MVCSRRGFTLIEMLIVIVIIGILAAIAIPKYAGMKQKSYVTTMKSDLRNLATAEEAFFADSGFYTATVTGKKKRQAMLTGTGLVFDPSTGVSDPLVTVGQGTWSATVTHAQVPNMTCGIAVNMANPVDATAGEGTPTCK